MNETLIPEAMNSIIGIIPIIIIIIIVTIVIGIAFAFFGHSTKEESDVQPKRHKEDDWERETRTKVKATPISSRDTVKYSSGKDLCPCGSGKRYEECCGN